MKLTKTQQHLLKLAEEETDQQVLINNGINLSDIIREVPLLESLGLLKSNKQTKILVEQGKKPLDTPNLPEYDLLTLLKEKNEIDQSEATRSIERRHLGTAINELKKQGLLELQKIDEITLLRYVQGESNPLIKLNETYTNLATEYEKGTDVEEQLTTLEKRKIIKIKEQTNYKITITPEGKEIRENQKEEVTKLTTEMIKTGSWKNVEFKEYNPQILGKEITKGRLHPLRQLAYAVEKIFRDMGYEYMAGPLVSDSLYNFDALFVPQDHPAREMQDTFYLEYPHEAKEISELSKRVKEMHENIFKYDWSEKTAKRNVLRTHTTAVTAEYLDKRDDRPMKLFSIGKVFRNEKIDAMHLPEFHQIEGVVIGDVDLRDLMGHISTFYEHIGLEGIRFKKTYNPYTEPSMEIFAYHPLLKKEVEVGNSGVFRPEMLEPFDYGDQSAIAWGLALERLASIIYNKPKIKEIYGPDVDIDWIREGKDLWL